MAITQAQKNGRKFLNPIPTRQASQPMIKLMWEFLTSKNEREPAQPLGPFHTDAGVYDHSPGTDLRVTWMGHSCVLIEIDGKRILTDPVWGERASFSSRMGPKRFFTPPLPLDKLPKLDLVLLSHDHYDHLDHFTIKQLAHISKAPVCCSLGVGKMINKWGVSNGRITELNWGETLAVGSDCFITATPARHFSGRGLVNRNTTLWSSFVIKGHTHNIFFGADSGIFPGFKEIGEEYGPFDLTMLEIGAYGDGWPDIHMGPANAVDAHLMLAGKLMMPIHWGTFNLALHPWREPIERLVQIAEEKGVALFIPRPGHPARIEDGKPHNSEWWV